MKYTPIAINRFLPFLFLFLALLFGGFARLYGVLRSSFPLNDGALFYTMTGELAANGFRLPEFSNFNGLHILFAYPPLGFYFAGLLSQFSGWSLQGVFRILPAIFTFLSIAAFYLLGLDLAEALLKATELSERGKSSFLVDNQPSL